MTKIAQTLEQADVRLWLVARRGRELDLPAALRGGPAAGALVLANLRPDRWRHEPSRDALHAVWLIEVSVHLMQPLVMILQLGSSGVTLTEGHDLLF